MEKVKRVSKDKNYKVMFLDERSVLGRITIVLAKIIFILLFIAFWGFYGVLAMFFTFIFLPIGVIEILLVPTIYWIITGASYFEWVKNLKILRNKSKDAPMLCIRIPVELLECVGYLYELIEDI